LKNLFVLDRHKQGEEGEKEEKIRGKAVWTKNKWLDGYLGCLDYGVWTLLGVWSDRTGPLIAAEHATADSTSAALGGLVAACAC
jgi:hypothetical protein